jgi:hypothetical protein
MSETLWKVEAQLVNSLFFPLAMAAAALVLAVAVVVLLFWRRRTLITYYEEEEEEEQEDRPAVDTKDLGDEHWFENPDGEELTIETLDTIATPDDTYQAELVDCDVTTLAASSGPTGE